jgi:predicted nucleic-acid-binding Zn-ribbon protein
MGHNAPTCPKCGGGMHDGYIATRRDRLSSVEANWVAGEPVESFWCGEYGVKAKSGMPITTLRCDACGYLESYAPET